MKTSLLIVEKCPEWSLCLGSKNGNKGQQVECLIDERLIKGDYHKDLLDVHFNDGLSNNGGSKERPERHQKMSAGNTGQIEQWIRNLVFQNKLV